MRSRSSTCQACAGLRIALRGPPIAAARRRCRPARGPRMSPRSADAPSLERARNRVRERAQNRVLCYCHQAVTSVADKSSRPVARRYHDAQASREALLGAARALFDERGYDRATTREIGERAAVDPALIARYFGGKEGLYLATIAEGPIGAPGELDFEPR